MSSLFLVDIPKNSMVGQQRQQSKYRNCNSRNSLHFLHLLCWKGDIMVADIEELEEMDASEIYSRRLNAKGSHISQRKWKIIWSLNNCISELQQQACAQRLELQDAWISTRTSSSTRRFFYEGKGSPRHSNPKHARNGRNEESSRTTSWGSFCAKINRKSRDNSAAHFPIAANARTYEFYE